MNKSLFSIATASLFALGVGVASADTTTSTTTTWTPDQGRSITQVLHDRKASSYNDPSVNPTVGIVLPPAVTIHPLPKTVEVPSPERYSYGIVNDHPVVVQRDNRTVVHTW